MNIATATPVEIDTELARLDGDQHKAEARLVGAWSTIHYTANDRKVYSGSRTSWRMSNEDALAAVQTQAADETHIGSDARKALASLEQATKAIAAIVAEGDAYRAEYNRRPWTRAFLAITNSKGHVHSSMDCPTCNNGIYRTQFGWQPEYSGADEATIIADAGYRACTVCYPNAPVETTPESHPTKMFTADERTAAQKRIEAAAAKSDRLAKKIANGLTADGSEFVIAYADGGYRVVSENEDGTTTKVWDAQAATRREYFKTERAASIWWVDAHVYAYGTLTESKQAAYDRIIQAMADKHGKTFDEVKAEMDAKVAAKIKREGR